MGDMAYLPQQRRFAMVVSRFVWEKDAKPGLFQRAVPQRIRAGVHFERVTNAQVQLLPVREKDAAFELLAMRFEGAADPDDLAGTVELNFAGGGSLRLHVECIEAYLSDMGEPWPVTTRPRHPGA
jgi:hypothetical protein